MCWIRDRALCSRCLIRTVHLRPASPRQRSSSRRLHPGNLGASRPVYNRPAQVRWIVQREGLGNGDPPPAGAFTAACGAARRAGRLAGWRFTGLAGCNSTTTGFGSATITGGPAKSPGCLTIATGTVAGTNLLRLNVTEKFSVEDGTGTVTEQGVLQPGPALVVASAPGGTDSNCRFTVCGAGLKISKEEKEEHPPRVKPANAIARNRYMIDPSTVAARRHRPRRDHREMVRPAQPPQPLVHA